MSNRSVGEQPDAKRTLTMLSDVPLQVTRLARGHSRQALHRQPTPDAWSARDIVAHLRACADVWGRSIIRMIEEDSPTIRYVSPRGWIRQTDYLTHDFRDSLHAFATGRRSLVDRLGLIGDADWARRATITGTRLGLEATVLSYATRILEHEVGHLDQLRRTLNA